MTRAPDHEAVLCLMGPTATGKTELALALAERLPLEIVSVDSAMVYCGMDIGTAKPDASVLARVPHHLIDVADPAESYSAARFRDDAVQAVEAIRAKGRTPLLTGGTMLYFAALHRGLSELPPADPALRQRINDEAARHGWAALHRRLSVLDPESAARIHPNDSQRIQRALEVRALTGRTRGDQYRLGRQPAPWPLWRIALTPAAGRQALHARIRQRFMAMMEEGLLREVEGLYRRPGLTPDLPAMRAVGYRQLWQHLDGHCTLEQAVERGVVATRQLAKRQVTWLRRESPQCVIDSESPRRLDAVIEAVKAASGAAV